MLQICCNFKKTDWNPDTSVKWWYFCIVSLTNCFVTIAGIQIPMRSNNHALNGSNLSFRVLLYVNGNEWSHKSSVLQHKFTQDYTSSDFMPVLFCVCFCHFFKLNWENTTGNRLEIINWRKSSEVVLKRSVFIHHLFLREVIIKKKYRRLRLWLKKSDRLQYSPGM